MINPLAQFAANPRLLALKRWLVALLQQRYTPVENIVERVGMSLITAQDFKEFGELMTAVYEAGYLRAMEQTKKQLDGMGIHVKIVAAQPEKSGETVDGEQVTTKPSA